METSKGVDGLCCTLCNVSSYMMHSSDCGSPPLTKTTTDKTISVFKKHNNLTVFLAFYLEFPYRGQAFQSLHQKLCSAIPGY